jgi:hypothetical protein
MVAIYKILIAYSWYVLGMLVFTSGFLASKAAKNIIVLHRCSRTR